MAHSIAALLFKKATKKRFLQFKNENVIQLQSYYSHHVFLKSSLWHLCSTKHFNTRQGFGRRGGSLRRHFSRAVQNLNFTGNIPIQRLMA